MKQLAFEESEYWEMVVQRNELMFALAYYAEGRHLSGRRKRRGLRLRSKVEDGALARRVLANMPVAGIAKR